jgi:hypothetical protein
VTSAVKLAVSAEAENAENKNSRVSREICFMSFIVSVFKNQK